jgi:hypothetical protein
MTLSGVLTILKLVGCQKVIDFTLINFIHTLEVCEIVEIKTIF